MRVEEFESSLRRACETLKMEAEESPFDSARDFETRVRALLRQIFGEESGIDLRPHPHLFPDIVIGRLGVEVKFTENDTWRSVANSVFEGTRSADVEQVYVLFGKMGGNPDVRWAKYEDCVMHVRTSHVPRFELEIGTDETLFEKIGIQYADFRVLEDSEKMVYIRRYARSRLKRGEKLWWLEDERDHGHTLPMQARLYMSLRQEEKRKLRAEAAILCPQIVKPSRAKHKYDDATLYLLTAHGVLCSQARDLFSAGSVAMRENQSRGGNYVLRALLDIESEMLDAADSLNESLFNEYWGFSPPKSMRIQEWLRQADGFAVGWKPSESLFARSHGK